MSSYNTFIFFLLFGVGTIYTFQIKAGVDNLNCEKSGIQCLNETSFTTCVNFENWTILTNLVLHCPEGFVCNTLTSYPCIIKVTTTEPTITETSNTTKVIVPRPSGEPNCTEVGLWPAPACTQYYECVQATSWVFWKYFKPELRTCADGEYYDTSSQTCMEAALSDCVE